MLTGFKQFMLRGNVLDLAVAVVMGAAFGAVVAALVKDLITPLIAAIVGKPDFSAIEFTVNGSKFPIGDFINALVSFILVGTAVYFFVVLPVNKLLARMRRGGLGLDLSGAHAGLATLGVEAAKRRSRKIFHIVEETTLASTVASISTQRSGSAATHLRTTTGSCPRSRKESSR